MNIECIKFKPFSKGNLLGFADIFVPKWGIEIYGLTIYEKEGNRWVNFPSKEYEKDGQKKYLPYFRFREDEHYNLFCSMVKKAIEKKMNEQQEEINYE